MTKAGDLDHWTTRWWFLAPITLANLLLAAYSVANGLYNLLGMRIEVLTGQPYPRTTTELVIAAAFVACGLVVIVATAGWWTRRRAAFARLALVGLAPIAFAVCWELGHELAATGGIEMYALRVFDGLALAACVASIALARRWHSK